MARKARQIVARPGEELASVWFHPQRGAVLCQGEVRRTWRSYRGGDPALWHVVATVRTTSDQWGQPVPVPGQALPRGFLWGEPAKQGYGLAGPTWVFGPLEKICRDCKEPFIDSARAQKHLLELGGTVVHTFAVRCIGCARRRRAIEAARKEYAAALEALVDGAPAAAYANAARAALALLEAGGAARVDRAIGHARRAAQQGARGAAALVDKLEALRERRALAAQGSRRAPRATSR